MIPDQRLAEQDEEAHAHRYDITPAMVAMDPLYGADSDGNPFFHELVDTYGEASAHLLWELAGEWHYCELTHELRSRQLRSAA